MASLPDGGTLRLVSQGSYSLADLIRIELQDVPGVKDVHTGPAEREPDVVPISDDLDIIAYAIKVTNGEHTSSLKGTLQSSTDRIELDMEADDAAFVLPMIRAAKAYAEMNDYHTLRIVPDLRIPDLRKESAARRVLQGLYRDDVLSSEKAFYVTPVARVRRNRSPGQHS